MQWTARIPQRERDASRRSMMGMPPTGTRGFGVRIPSAFNLLPSPAAMIPAIIGVMYGKIREKIPKWGEISKGGGIATPDGTAGR